MRLMLDTCVIIDMLTDVDSISAGALDMLSDRNNQLFAITEHLPLLSSDLKFPFYRAQGLDLIEY